MESADKPKITDITIKVVELLTPLDSIERQRVIQASFLLLGETPLPSAASSFKNEREDPLEQEQGLDELSKQAKIWLKQNNITQEQLQRVFHISNGESDIISDIPGKDLKAKTLNAYILLGISRFLTTGESNFDDKAARTLCKHSGCYNEGNHAVYLKGKGNTLTGSKDSGWKLTAPGLKYGAELVKQISD